MTQSQVNAVFAVAFAEQLRGEFTELGHLGRQRGPLGPNHHDVHALCADGGGDFGAEHAVADHHGFLAGCQSGAQGTDLVGGCAAGASRTGRLGRVAAGVARLVASTTASAVSASPAAVDTVRVEHRDRLRHRRG
ncbi:hypothetical protein [Actinoalloteichus hymeniacidonis]|uniref:hypothetical protein n=1 Tax=Actinoalloteichus hymeniacidonis TaxID=340345 RepID=UPI0012F989D0|nr:hypothetical protein [Actinoalloteichus hymeniacidonis]MBB5907937.1 hypothetical protein [Actinoalloteichus hymeniacidonis]